MLPPLIKLRRVQVVQRGGLLIADIRCVGDFKMQSFSLIIGCFVHEML
jgi:hypothetical protein